MGTRARVDCTPEEKPAIVLRLGARSAAAVENDKDRRIRLLERSLGPKADKPTSRRP
jgi:hypothetical protein